jgi:hypothetical protein
MSGLRKVWAKIGSVAGWRFLVQIWRTVCYWKGAIEGRPEVQKISFFGGAQGRL